MKRTLSLSFTIAIILSACASPAVVTQAPMEQVKSTSTVQPPVEVIPVENTATVIPPESTSIPESPRWYWEVDGATAKVIAVNQFGETRELGAVDPSDILNTASISLDEERALLFVDSNNDLRVHLLTLDGMQKIVFPSNSPEYNTEFSQTSRAVLATYDDHVLFSYVTDGSSNIMPDQGPIFLIDLTSLTATLIDERVSRAPYSDNRNWIHASQDGRHVRYLNGDRQNMDIRELDMLTGEVRTLHTTRGSSFGIHASPQGDLWYLRDSQLILDLNDNQIDFVDEMLTFRPLKDGWGVSYPRDCAGDCEITVNKPFGNEAALTYYFPWAMESGAFDGMVNQLLPDQSLLFVGKPYATLSSVPAAAETYPDMTEQDSPVFRLTPDGQARLVGIHAGHVSADRRYMLLKSSDQASFFIYDAIADRPLFDMPVDTTLDVFFTTTKFLDTGILVNLDAAVRGEENNYRNFFHAYSYNTSTAQTWEDVNLEYGGCSDLLDDGSVVCRLYSTDTSNFDLVRHDPAGEIETVLKNVWWIDFTP